VLNPRGWRRSCWFLFIGLITLSSCLLELKSISGDTIICVFPDRLLRMIFVFPDRLLRMMFVFPDRLLRMMFVFPDRLLRMMFVFPDQLVMIIVLLPENLRAHLQLSV
jgi:hypothetical protein